jgi:threonine dehydratase
MKDKASSRNGVRWTPLQHSHWLSEHLGVPVHLKLECWQKTGSFKLRGAVRALAGLDPGIRARGVVTASAGNHGQAVALAARSHGVGAIVFVPDRAPLTKQARIRQYGAELRLVAGSYDDAARAARALSLERGVPFVHPFNDPDVVAGQGTVGVEILEDLPDVRQVVVPVGGGGLVAGVGAALKSADSGVRIIGVQSTETRAMHAAFAAGKVVATPVVPTLCDGLAGEVEPESFLRAREVVDSLHMVGEADVATAIRELYVHEGVVAEGSGAVGVAAALTGRLDPAGPVVIVISGGNIDRADLARILAGE